MVHCVQLLQSLARNVRVDRRRRDVGVTEQELDNAQIGAMVQQVRRECMAQDVRRQRSRWNAGRHRVALDQRPERLPRQGPLALREEYLVSFARAGQCGTNFAQVTRKPGDRFVAEREVTPAEYAEAARRLDRTLDEVKLGDPVETHIHGRTGVGQRVETSLLDGVLAMQAGRVFWAESAEPPAAVRDLLGDRVSRIYPTREGHLYLYVELPKFWRGLCRTLGLEAWLADPRLRTMVGRHTHKAELIAVITERLAAETAAVWEARFTEADVPCTRVRSVPEILVDPQALFNGALATVEDPALGPVRLLGVPVRLLGTPGAPAGPPPALGAHTDAILAEAGVAAAEIARLRQTGVVR